jgi:hypothetical protein
MVVPYGDPNEPHYRKNAFDAGEDGLGKNAHSLKKVCWLLSLTCFHFDSADIYVIKLSQLGKSSWLGLNSTWTFCRIVQSEATRIITRNNSFSHFS